MEQKDETMAEFHSIHSFPPGTDPLRIPFLPHLLHSDHHDHIPRVSAHQSAQYSPYHLHTDSHRNRSATIVDTSPLVDRNAHSRLAAIEDYRKKVVNRSHFSERRIEIGIVADGADRCIDPSPDTAATTVLDEIAHNTDPAAISRPPHFSLSPSRRHSTNWIAAAEQRTMVFYPAHQNCSSEVLRWIVDAQISLDPSRFASFVVSSVRRRTLWHDAELTKRILLLDPGCRDQRRIELA